MENEEMKINLTPSTEIMRFDDKGNIFINGKLIENDTEVVQWVNKFIPIHGKHKNCWKVIEEKDEQIASLQASIRELVRALETISTGRACWVGTVSKSCIDFEPCDCANIYAKEVLSKHPSIKNSSKEEGNSEKGRAKQD